MSSAYKTVRSFLVVSLVLNQSKTNFNVDKNHERLYFYQPFIFRGTYSMLEPILMHEPNFEEPYYLFVFCSSQEDTLKFHHLIKLYYQTLVESYIDQKHILLGKAFLACLHIFQF